MIAEKLRKAVLQAAIQGKLTEQLTEDGDARDLLKEIQQEKARLVKEGKLKKENPLPPITEDEIPFGIPDNWVWVRLGELIELISGQDMQPHFYHTANSGVPYITGASNFLNGQLIINRYTDKPKAIAYQGDLLLTCKGTVGEMAFLYEEKAHIARQVMAIRKISNIDLNYIQLFLSYYVDELNALAKSMIPGISRSSVLLAMIPLPPLDEQLRIIEKSGKIQLEIKKLEADESKLEALEKAFPQQLKNAILQAAIQGKLTEQLPEDGDARDLLKQIQQEKASLVKAGKLKKEKPLPPITEDDLPFDIPDNWVWVRLGELSSYIQRGKSPKYSSIRKYPVIAQKCNQWDGLKIEKAQFIDPSTLSNYDQVRFLLENDLLWNSTGLGTLGRMVIYRKELNPFELAVADSHVTVIRLLDPYVVPEFVFYFIIGPYIQSIVEDISTGTTKQKELGTSTIKSITIPFPPLPEQERMVERLEELLPLCEKLE